MVSHFLLKVSSRDEESYTVDYISVGVRLGVHFASITVHFGCFWEVVAIPSSFWGEFP